MAFKKREYNQFKKLCKESLKQIPNHEIYGCKPIFPPSILLNMMPDYLEVGNYEACKAIEDTIREWFIEHDIEIPEGATLNIPPKSKEEFHGHIDMADGTSYNF